MRKLESRALAALALLAIGLTATPDRAAAQEMKGMQGQKGKTMPQKQEAMMQEGQAMAQMEQAPEVSRQIKVMILGMSCPFCAYGVEQKLKKLEGVEDLEVVLDTGMATLTMEEGADVSNEELEKRVKEAGFEVAKITRSFESEYPEYDAKKKG